MVVVEKYPDLKANEGFLKLQDELAGTGKPHLGGKDALQPSGPGLQHKGAKFPVEYHRQHLQL